MQLSGHPKCETFIVIRDVKDRSLFHKIYENLEHETVNIETVHQPADEAARSANSNREHARLLVTGAGSRSRFTDNVLSKSRSDTGECLRERRLNIQKNLTTSYILSKRVAWSGAA